MMLRIGQTAATVPVFRLGDCHAQGPAPPDPPREMPDPRDGEKRDLRRGVVGSQEDDTRSVGAGRGAAGAGLEPGAGLGAAAP